MRKHLALLVALFMLLGLVMGMPLTMMAESETSAEETEAEAAEETAAEESEAPAEEAPAEEASEEETEAEPEKMVDADTLVVGAPELNADYINGFGNSSYDVYIKYLIGNYDGDCSYATYYPDEAGQFKLNPTVCPSDPVVTSNEDGTKTYTFEIVSDLVWNDGTPITAKDYVFSYLFHASPEWKNQGANNATAAEDIFGFDEYHDGKTRSFAGVGYIDDTHFFVTIKADRLPYFYETAMVASTPTPLHRYAPNVDIVGSEIVAKEGYEVTDTDKENVLAAEEKALESKQETLKGEQEWWDGEDQSAYSDDQKKEEEDLLASYQQAVDEQVAKIEKIKSGEIELDPISSLMVESTYDVAYNYRFKPDVTCGPYNFVSYENRMAKVTLNDKFKGNAEGKKPTIKNIIVQTINAELEMDYLLSGFVDLIPGLTEAKKIDKGKENPDKVGYSNYPRNGYGVLSIRNDYSPTQYAEVRKAIAYCIDRDQFVAEISGGYALVIDGCFGINQFEYLDKGEELEADPEWNHYTLNTEAANAELDNSPYKFEADGVTPWDAEKAQQMYESNKDGFDYWRYDENKKPLRIIHYGAEGIDTTKLIQVMLPDNAKRCGMNYIVKPVDFATLLDAYYSADPATAGPDEATCFNMGTNFGIPDDKYWSYHSSQIGVGANNDRVNSPELDEILVNMRQKDPTDVEGWEEGWVAFQKWYNQNMPDIPLYANDYHDFFTLRVQGLETTPMWDWYRDICDVSLGEVKADE